MTVLIVTGVVAFFSFCPPISVRSRNSSAVSRVDFVKDVQPIFAQHCYSCHGVQKQSGGLALHQKSRALRGGDHGPVIKPGDGSQSRLLERVGSPDPELAMPPSGVGKPLTAHQINLLRSWIEQGAVWPEGVDDHPLAIHPHWAYRPPSRPTVPKVRNTAWPRNSIDYFILARLEAAGLLPSPPAEKAQLLRRVSLDLIGLPPTLMELDAFLRDERPDAYERLVDRLLASPHYGERWARPWLDLARYADTNGYEKDRPRNNWLWRDWLIQALNEDMPFDQFTLEQLAGDLLPSATIRQQIATGFHRNTMLNDEDGINPEEFRVLAVKDRVDTTATVWLGTTLECAQCHSHKHDPFSQAEYYQFYAFFNQTEDNGVGQGPELPVPSAAESHQLQRLQAAIAVKESEIQGQTTTLNERQRVWELSMLKTSPPQMPVAQLAAHYPLVKSTDPWREAQGLRPAAQWRGGEDVVPTILGVKLDGFGSHLEVAEVARWDKQQSFSLGCWVKPEVRQGCLVGRMEDGDHHHGFALELDQGRLVLHLADSSFQGNALKVATRTTLVQGRWHHVWATYDGSGQAKGISLFLDGRPTPVVVEQDNLRGSIRAQVPLKIGQRQHSGALAGWVRDVRLYERKLTDDEVRQLASWHPANDLVAIPVDERTEEEAIDLSEYYTQVDAILVRLRAELAALQAEVSKIRPATGMILRELSQPRPTHVHLRGDYRRLGLQVQPDVPGALHPWPVKAPRNRLGLARWLVDARNPLVGRVTVNRTWEAFFGRGIVGTPGDFGTLGDAPIHPELLDWLAVEFRDRRGSMKVLHRLIVTSATYCQSSAAAPALVLRDPQNGLYARGPRFRLDYETLRDQALAVSGLLSRQIGGPSVMPPQPAGVWEQSFGFYDLPDFRWREAVGPDRYRRGIYTYLRRTAPYPGMLLYDAPTRETCSVQRFRTNTPLQALCCLNDPVFVEAAGNLARRILLEGGTTWEERLRFAFMTCLSRPPNQQESAALLRLYQTTRGHYNRDQGAAQALVRQFTKGPPTEQMADLAAWTLVANVLLNLDEMLTKG